MWFVELRDADFCVVCCKKCDSFADAMDFANMHWCRAVKQVCMHELLSA